MKAYKYVEDLWKCKQSDVLRRPTSKGIVYDKPKHYGINELKFEPNLRSVAEERAGSKLTNLRVLNSYWVNQDATYKYFEVIMVDYSHKVIRRDPRINWIAKARRSTLPLRRYRS
ncbi:unnamed protein product [Peronospora destructor]|uniref:Ribosomal protein L15 n=1 Tax=Peronospora destructor TaxID=86335 RepID=A0AAV0TFG1_9STRA|nr:unnamed protein product [Peronospora destructor]